MEESNNSHKVNWEMINLMICVFYLFYFMEKLFDGAFRNRTFFEETAQFEVVIFIVRTWPTFSQICTS